MCVCSWQLTVVIALETCRSCFDQIFFAVRVSRYQIKSCKTNTLYMTLLKFSLENNISWSRTLDYSVCTLIHLMEICVSAANTSFSKVPLVMLLERQAQNEVKRFTPFHYPYWQHYWQRTTQPKYFFLPHDFLSTEAYYRGNVLSANVLLRFHRKRKRIRLMRIQWGLKYRRLQKCLRVCCRFCKEGFDIEFYWSSRSVITLRRS